MQVISSRLHYDGISEDLPDEGMIDRWEFFLRGHVVYRTTGTLTELTCASWSIPPLEMHLAFPVIEISIGKQYHVTATSWPYSQGLSDETRTAGQRRALLSQLGGG